MNSAIEKAQEFNKEKILSSIMFLSDLPDNRPKARYVTTTYTELVRRISRLGIKASIHVPVNKIGSLIDEKFAMDNLMEIVNAGNKAGVFVWAAFDRDYGEMMIPEKFARMKGFGVAAPCDVVKNIADMWGANAVKMVFGADSDSESKAHVQEIKSEIEKRKTVVVSSPSRKLLSEISKSRFKKSIILEFGLGYSKRKIIKLSKKGFVTSMCVPFGKDWTSYAIGMVPDRKAGFIVGSLLKEEERRII